MRMPPKRFFCLSFFYFSYISFIFSGKNFGKLKFIIIFAKKLR